MPLSISTNIASLSAQRSFLNSNAALETSERLASGKRINSSSDDAAGGYCRRFELAGKRH